MLIQELKNKIENDKLDETFLIFKLEDLTSEFIARQYTHKIAEQKGLTIKYIESTKDIKPAGFIEDDNLYLMKVDQLEEFEPHENCIIWCNKTNYKDVIKIPKLEHWQFIDYLLPKVPGINKADLDWLITQYEVTDSRVTTTNYFRLDNDIDKIAIFDTALQDQMFNDLYNSGEFNTTSNLTIFDLSNALIEKDANTALEVLKVFDYIDSKPHVWLLSILINNFRNIVNIQLGKNVTAESLGISDKQFYVLKKYHCGHYNTEQLINIYDMLTNIEYMYKFGGLTQDQLADYIICKIITA